MIYKPYDMKKSYTLLVFILFIGISICKAQDYQPGYVIMNDGTRVGGVIALNEAEPWYNQRYIRVKDSVAFAKDPNVKPKRIKADDMKFYVVGTRLFDKVHYVDLQNLQLKSMGTNDHMMERLAVGRITAHRFYEYPADVAVYVASEEEIERREKEKKDALIRGYFILAQKDNDKLRNAFDYDLQKYFEDTPEVLEKYKSGSYGNQPVKKGLAARMVAMAKKTAFKQEEADGIVAAFNDYNSKNATK